MEVESPDSGLTVPSLKDILNQAKLYIISLKSYITDELYRVVEVNNGLVYGNLITHVHVVWYSRMSLSQLSSA